MKSNKSSLLIDETPLQVLPTLAVSIGLNEAIFIQQLHWLLRHSGKVVAGQEGRWVYNTANEWHDKYPFWSIATIKRIVAALKEKNLIKVGRFNKMAIDQTRWYSIDYDELQKLELPLYQNELMESPIVSNCTNPLAQNDPMTLAQNDPMLPKNKNTYQRKEEATPPPPPPIEEKPTDHPFVVIYREVFKRYPNKAQMAQLVNQAEPLFLDLWRAACSAWLMAGYKPDNLRGILDWYRDGVPERGNGKLTTITGTPKPVETRTVGGVIQEKVGGVWYNKRNNTPTGAA